MQEPKADEVKRRMQEGKAQRPKPKVPASNEKGVKTKEKRRSDVSVCETDEGRSMDE